MDIEIVYMLVNFVFACIFFQFSIYIGKNTHILVGIHWLYLPAEKKQ